MLIHAFPSYMGTNTRHYLNLNRALQDFCAELSTDLGIVHGDAAEQASRVKHRDCYAPPWGQATSLTSASKQALALADL